MRLRLRRLLITLGEAFWLVPGLMVIAGILGAIGLVDLDRAGIIPARLLSGSWLYNGGATGARTLLGAIASSTIGVAGTIFSITIAALSLAAGQMGPRLLRNFTVDRGNQFTLGAFLGTFCYALMVLRSVRTRGEGEFIPHLSLTFGIVLAFLCVGTLVYFVGHMAGRINVDTVIELVSADVNSAIRRLTTNEQQPVPPPAAHWKQAVPVKDSRSGYLQHLDSDSLAAWARDNATAIRLLARAGDFVFPNSPIAVMLPAVAGAEEAIREATAVGAQRVGSEDLEYPVRQLVEVAVRALSPGVNDPHTAMSVLDRLGAALCEIASVRLTTGVFVHDGRVVLVVPNIDYDGLLDAMFHLIRQNAASSTTVLIRMLEVMTGVIGSETDSSRVRSVQRHANLVLGDAERSIGTPADLAEVRDRYQKFLSAVRPRE